MFFFRGLKKTGVLGMNSRNIEYISRFNPRSRFFIVDNKLETKRAAQQAGISVPKLIGVIENNAELRNLESIISPLQKFVIKPTRGSGGKGILVIGDRDGADYIKSSGRKMTLSEVHHHVNNILSGLYSLGGKSDSAMIETMIEYADVFNDYTYEGVPDLRVIVFRGFPVMAMLRCATHASDGRANLHQGAIGVGIDLATGKSLYAVQRNKPVEIHPDTVKSFSDLVIPHWQQILELSASCYEMTGLGYIGCDIVIDKYQGPVILELNARPGLSIQMANGAGLKPRLDLINKLDVEILNLHPAQRVEYVQNHLIAEWSKQHSH
jgi:alpha-L-glutamate ligase-like protein